MTSVPRDVRALFNEKHYAYVKPCYEFILSMKAKALSVCDSEGA